MKLKTWAPAILAVVLGVVAAVLVRNSMMRKPAASPVAITPKMVPALVATTDLVAGQTISADDVSITTVPSQNGPDPVIANPSEAVGRNVTGPLVKGEAIHQSSLAPRGAPQSLISLVGPGMRAITINVDEGNTFSGMLLPGCHVDVIASIASGKDSLNRLLVNNVLVQAVGQRLTSAAPADGKEPPPFHTATLIVTLRQAQVIDLAGQNARLRLVLRPLTHSPTDDSSTENTVKLAEVFGNESGPAVAAIPMASQTQPSANPDPTPVPDDEPPVASIPVADSAPTRRSVTLILGTQSTQVSLQMPPEPTVQEAGTIQEQKPIIDGEEPSQP